VAAICKTKQFAGTSTFSAALHFNVLLLHRNSRPDLLSFVLKPVNKGRNTRWNCFIGNACWQ